MTATLDDREIRRAFERAAPRYDEAAFLQREVADRLLERLEVIRIDPSRILDLGCGTGRASDALKQRHRKARVLGLDPVHAMARRTRRRSRWMRPVDAVCGDARRLPLASNSIDLVFSNLMLPWVGDRRACFDELRRVMRPDGVLLFTTFGPDTLGELRQSWAAANDGPHVHDFDDMHHVGDELVQAGFSDPVMDVETLTVAYPDVRSLMRDLKASGARNARTDRARGLTGRRGFQSMLERYEQHRSDGVIPATLEVVYGHALAPKEGQPRRTEGGQEASFSVDSLRNTIRRKER